MDPDYPFYNGRPVQLTGAQWAFVMLTVVLGFASLVWPALAALGGSGEYVAAVLFSAFPLLGLARVARRHWTALFRRVGLRELGWMVAFALLNIVVSMAVGAGVMKTVGASANPAIVTLSGQTGPERLAFFAKTGLQLLGEELVTILPFLALLWWLTARAGLSRHVAITCAWLVSAAWFGALHLPTYQWNVVQSFVIIGSARLVLSMAYMKTKNIWVSTGAHILNDWSLFGLSLLGAGLLGK
jgi:hypothetical protein